MFELIRDLDRRTHREEWLDDPLVPPLTLIDSLLAVGRVNRVTGGLSTSLAGLESLWPPDESRHDETNRSLTILDVGTGDGSFIDAVLDRFDSPSLDLNIVGLELAAPVVNWLRRRYDGVSNVTIIQRDLFELDDVDAVDIVHASLVLHHFPEDRIAPALAIMKRLATTGIVINDLHRHGLAHAASHVLLRAVTSDVMARRDGPLSVRRSFSRRDLQTAARRAGLADAAVTWRWPFRWLLTAPLRASMQ